MDELAKLPGGLPPAAATAQAVAERLNQSSAECERLLKRESERAEELKPATDERINDVRDAAADLDVCHQHYLSAHMVAHSLTAVAALAGYAGVPWFLLWLLTPIIGSPSRAVWGLVWVCLAVGLVAAPLLNVGLRNVVERLEGITLVRQTHLVLLLPVLPLLSILCIALVDSGRLTEERIRMMAWTSGPVLVAVIWLLPYALKGVWKALGEALESFVGFCTDALVALIALAVRLVNVVRMRFGKRPLRPPTPYGGKVQEPRRLMSPGFYR
jgi:hypothetical protein